MLYTGIHAQTKSILSGRIKGLPDGTKVKLIAQMATVKWKDSTVIKNERFSFTRPVENPGRYTFLTDRGYSSGTWRDIYIDNGPIQLVAEAGRINKLKLSGTKSAKDFMAFDSLLTKDHLYENRILEWQMTQDAQIKKDSVLAKKAYQFRMKNDSILQALSLQWVSQHPGSAMSSFILYGQFLYSIGMLDTLLPKLTAKDNILYAEMRERVDAYKATGIGMSAPLFTQNDPEGNAVSLSSLRGSYVLIDFWASWCVPCRAESPFMIPVYNKHKDKKFSLIGVSLDDSKSAWLEAIKNDSLPWIQVSDLNSWQNEIAKKYYIHSVPANYLISPEGKIVAKNLSPALLDKTLTELLK